MNQRVNQVFGIFLVILCFNSLVYQQIKDTGLHEENYLDNLNGVSPIDNTDNKQEEIDKDTPVIKSETLGNFKTMAFFPGGTGYIYGASRVGESLIYDPSGEDPLNRRNVHEWVTYDEIKDDGTLNKEMYWRALSSEPQTWPNDTNWFYLRERNAPYEPSKIYSPAFTEEYEITGKVHYLSYWGLNDSVAFSEAITIGYRQNLYLFNPADPLNPTLLATRTNTYSISTGSWQRTYSDFIDVPNTIIPVGYRLRWDIQVRFSSVPTAGSFLQYSGYSYSGGGSTTWTINDGIYSNTYSINNVSRMAGIQLYMRSRETPDISVLGATNNTVYQSDPGMSIDVTDGSISSYRWDGGTWISFENQTSINLPTGQGWHDLEIKASDPVFNNTRVDYYRFGYDNSVTNVILNSPTNNSLIAGGTILDFSAFNVPTVDYMWDNNGSWFSLLDPYDVTSPEFNSLHNITIRTTDFYTTEYYFYSFTYDSTYPSITLLSILNGSTQSPGKAIEVEIVDTSGFDYIFFHWDSDGDALWSPIQGNIYRTFLPEAIGNHFLYITAADNLGYISTTMYFFYADDSVFLVELTELRNDSYYQGGEDVILTVLQTNGTLRYVWDSGTIKDGSIIGGQVILTGVDALNTTPGEHNLTIITFDTLNSLQILYFKFTVDQTAPVIDSGILSYNNSRFKTNTILEFNITDNIQLPDELFVYISIDGADNQTLSTPFELNLISFSDGQHYFYLYAIDIAGNYVKMFIIFYIDTTKPSIVVNIPKVETIFGENYIPYNAKVEITIDDEDSTIFSYYSWDGSTYTSFTNQFFLSFPDGTATLLIKVNDTLGNYAIYQTSLTIDSIAPEILNPSPGEFSVINDNTEIAFDVFEINPNTLTLVRFYWDCQPLRWKDVTTSYLSSIEINTYPAEYEHNANATVFIETKDILGNNDMFNFTFIIDYEDPIILLEILKDGKWVTLDATEKGDPITVTGNSVIRYNTSTNNDLESFYYKWDNDELLDDYLSDINGWNFSVRPEDGLHNVTVILTDLTEGDNPNTATETFYILIDDINIDFITPTSWINNQYTILPYLNYSDTFSFTVNITDTTTGSEIGDLSTFYEQPFPSYGLWANYVKLDNTTYVWTLSATNITNGELTWIDFIFETSTGGKQTLRVWLKIYKLLGDLSILENSDTSVLYGDDVNIYFNLQNILGNDTKISYLEVNDEEINSTNYVEISPDNYTFTYLYNYSTYGLSKGNYSLKFYVESTFYYGETNGEVTIEFEVLPLPMQINVVVSNYTVLVDTDVVITAFLTYENGTLLRESGHNLLFYIYTFTYDNSSGVNAFIPTNYTSLLIEPRTTDPTGNASVIFTITDDIDYIMVAVTFEGDDFRDASYFEFPDQIIKIYLSGLPSWLLYLLIGGSILVIGLISLIVYRVTRPKPFEELMDGITEKEIEEMTMQLSPGVVLTIFDQRKGPIPLVGKHKLDDPLYAGRMVIGVENFLLKISDQAYSSLGFEEHDSGRRVGSIILPTERLIGFVHGMQLPNKAARGGFENLSLIVLADSEYGNMLLNYQEYLYDEIDALIHSLKSRAKLEGVEDWLDIIAKKAIKIMIAAIKLDKIQA